MNYKRQAQDLLAELLSARAEVEQLKRQLAHYEGETLSRAQARELHRELGKLGIGNDEQYLIAERTLGREVKSFTSIDEEEAARVRSAAERVHRLRNPGPLLPTDDEEALTVLGRQS